jgi:hypothetical protein
MVEGKDAGYAQMMRSLGELTWRYEQWAYQVVYLSLVSWMLPLIVEIVKLQRDADALVVPVALVARHHLRQKPLKEMPLMGWPGHLPNVFPLPRYFV